MSSFGEALVGAFNSTYGTVTRGRLAAEQAATLRADRQAEEQQRADVRAAQIRRGLINADGSPRDGAGGTAPAAPLEAPAAAPVSPDLGAPTSPAQTGAQGAPASAAPTPPAPAAQGVAPVSGAPAAPAPAPAPAQAAPPQPGMPTAKPEPAPAPAGGNVQPPAQAGAQGAPGAPQPPMPVERVQEIARTVDSLPEGERAVGAMLAAGAIAPPAQRRPGSDPAQYAQRLTAEIAQNRGPERRGPLTMADWNGYLQDVTLAAQRNLSAPQQAQALAVVDRIRQSGLQRFTALAVAAAQAGDMQGAARALQGASSFNPDGYQDTFRATANGVEMVRRPESGVNGQETRVTVGRDDVIRYATAMLNPQWSLEHFLNVRKQDETERRNQADEGIRRSAIAESAAGRREARATTRAGQQADSAMARAWMAYNNARERGAPAEETTRLRDAYEAAAASEGVTSAGIARIEGLERGRMTAADQRANRDRLQPAEQTRLDRAIVDFEDDSRNRTGRGADAGLTPAAQTALNLAPQVYALNRDQDPRAILRGIREATAGTAGYGMQGDRLVGPGGLSLVMPPRRPGAGNPRDPGASTNPPAPTEGDSGRNASMVGAGGARAAAPPPPSNLRRIEGEDPALERRRAVVEAQRRRNRPTVDEWVADNAGRSLSREELVRAATRLDTDMRILQQRLEAERSSRSGGTR